jgi:hypothetical protein
MNPNLVTSLHLVDPLNEVVPTRCHLPPRYRVYRRGRGTRWFLVPLPTSWLVTSLKGCSVSPRPKSTSGCAEPPGDPPRRSTGYHNQKGPTP